MRKPAGTFSGGRFVRKKSGRGGCIPVRKPAEALLIAVKTACETGGIRRAFKANLLRPKTL